MSSFSRFRTLAWPVGCALFLAAFAPIAMSQEPTPPHLVTLGANGQLAYHPYTSQGDTIPDFSNCGYGGGGVALPLVAAKITLQPQAAGDDLPRLQAAVDQVAQMPRAANGFRGALVLARGQYRLSDSLKISASGIVIRGEGADAAGTVLIGTRRNQYPLIVIAGQDLKPVAATQQTITTAYVPVGSHTIDVADASKYKVGDTVSVVRHGNADWIHTIKMDQIKPRDPAKPEATMQWKPFDLAFDRVVTGITGNRLTLDAPITCAIETQWGGGAVVKMDEATRIDHVGVENLFGDCEFDASVTSNLIDSNADPKRPPYMADENHATFLVSFEDVTNAWGRDLGTRHLQGVASMLKGAKWLTIQDCTCVEPVSIITGSRRYSYSITASQLVLVQRCYANQCRHAFVVGSRVCGPNVFLDCHAENTYNTSEPHHRWSVGGLYDNVNANMAIQDRQYLGTGHGWAGANYVAWNCSGSLALQSPPTAKNFAIGFTGKKAKPAFEGPDGWWESFGHAVEPRSLYQSQLQARLGAKAIQNIAKSP